MIMDRIFFVDKSKCYQFFEEIKRKSGIKSWSKLSKIIGISRSMIDEYRKGKLCIPENIFNMLLNYLDENKRQEILRITERRSQSWGQVIGGKRAYTINKKKFDSGRKFARSGKVKYEFDINLPLTEELCEFIGAFIGDGFTNKYGGHMYQFQITGDSKLDFDYYYNKLEPICKKIFEIKPKITVKGGCIRLNIYSKRVFELFTKRFKFPAGRKSYLVMIPDEIYNNSGLLSFVLRGMFDTDGGIGIDKRKAYKKPDIRINYTSVSKKLIDQVHEALLTYGLAHSIHKKGSTFMIQINGANNVERFITNIGFSNKRHLDKVKTYL